MSRRDSHVAAAALLKLTKKAQNGTATALDASAVPPAWRGYLVPKGSEVPGPNGERRLTDLLTDLRAAVVKAVAPLSPMVTFDESIPPWIPALVAASHVWTAPVQVRGGGSMARSRTNDDLARAWLGEALRPDPYDGEVQPPFVVLPDLDEALEASLREIASTLRSMRPKRPWEELVDLRSSTRPAPVAVLFDLVVDAAVERFTTAGGTPGPVIACLQRATQTGALDGAGLREPKRCRAPGACACHRCVSTRGPTSRQPGREARRGLIALTVAAWQLTTDVVEVAPAPLVGIASRAGPSPLGSDELAGIGALLTLHGRRYQSWHVEEGDVGVLLLAAAELDAMQDRPTLAAVADIAARVVWATARGWTPPRHQAQRTPDLDHAVAQLARSTAGAFRELRRPYWVLATLTPLEPLFDGSPHGMKVHEARQDVQLAFQRAGLWRPAAASFDLAVQKMKLFDEDYEGAKVDEKAMLRQKGEEVTEQLLLGRVGGLVQEAEALVCAGQGDAAGAALAGAHTAVGLLLAQLQALQAEHFSAADRPGKPGYLRYDEPWAVMPTLMEYRIAVAGVLVAHCERRTYSEAKAARAAARRARGKAVDLRRIFTERHRWEMQRIDVIAALSDDDLDFEDAVRAVVTAGGDDGVGDYVLPLLRWAATIPLFRDRVTGSALQIAIDRLTATAAAHSPRLPDLQALAPTRP